MRKKLGTLIQEEFRREQVNAPIDIDELTTHSDVIEGADQRELDAKTKELHVKLTVAEELHNLNSVVSEMLDHDHSGEDAAEGMSSEAYMFYKITRDDIYKRINQTSLTQGCEHYYEGDYTHLMRVSIEENESMLSKLWKWISDTCQWIINKITGENNSVNAIQNGEKELQKLRKQAETLLAKGVTECKPVDEAGKKKYAKTYAPAQGKNFTYLSALELLDSNVKSFTPQALAADINAFITAATPAIEKIGQDIKPEDMAKNDETLAKPMQNLAISSSKFFDLKSELKLEDLPEKLKKGIADLKGGGKTDMMPHGDYGYAFYYAKERGGKKDATEGKDNNSNDVDYRLTMGWGQLTENTVQDNAGAFEPKTPDELIKGIDICISLVEVFKEKDKAVSAALEKIKKLGEITNKAAKTALKTPEQKAYAQSMQKGIGICVSNVTQYSKVWSGFSKYALLLMQESSKVAADVINASGGDTKSKVDEDGPTTNPENNQVNSQSNDVDQNQNNPS